MRQEHASFAYNVVNFAITTPLVIFSIVLIARHMGGGDFGKAWICFAATMILWFIAENIWAVYELVYETDPWPSEADFFWLAGYPTYYLFTFFYLRPFNKAISKKNDTTFRMHYCSNTISFNFLCDSTRL